MATTVHKIRHQTAGVLPYSFAVKPDATFIETILAAAGIAATLVADGVEANLVSAAQRAARADGAAIPLPWVLLVEEELLQPGEVPAMAPISTGSANGSASSAIGEVTVSGSGTVTPPPEPTPEPPVEEPPDEEPPVEEEPEL